MPTITYRLADGGVRTVDVPNGQSVKDGAIGNGVPGILAEYGGQCACATCHVYIDASWWEAVGVPAAIEMDMLDFEEATPSNKPPLLPGDGHRAAGRTDRAHSQRAIMAG